MTVLIKNKKLFAFALLFSGLVVSLPSDSTSKTKVPCPTKSKDFTNTEYEIIHNPNYQVEKELIINSQCESDQIGWVHYSYDKYGRLVSSFTTCNIANNDENSYPIFNTDYIKKSNDQTDYNNYQNRRSIKYHRYNQTKHQNFKYDQYEKKIPCPTKAQINDVETRLLTRNKYKKDSETPALTSSEAIEARLKSNNLQNDIIRLSNGLSV